MNEQRPSVILYGGWWYNVVDELTRRYEDRFQISVPGGAYEHRLLPMVDLAAVVEAVVAVLALLWNIWTGISKRGRAGAKEDLSDVEFVDVQALIELLDQKRLCIVPRDVVLGLTKRIRKEGEYGASYDLVLLDPPNMYVIVSRQQSHKQTIFKIRVVENGFEVTVE